MSGPDKEGFYPSGEQGPSEVLSETQWIYHVWIDASLCDGELSEVICRASDAEEARILASMCCHSSPEERRMWLDHPCVHADLLGRATVALGRRIDAAAATGDKDPADVLLAVWTNRLETNNR